MAELSIRVRNNADGTRQDGDIVEAFTDNRRQFTQANVICWGGIKANAKGTPRNDALAKEWHELCRQYRFSRVSSNEVVVDTLDSAGQVTATRQVTNAELARYGENRLQAENHKIFGVPGGEIWFGGLRDWSAPVTTNMWTAIERATPHRKIDFDGWWHGSSDVRRRLMIRVDDMTEEMASTLTEPVYSVGGDMIRLSNFTVDWRSILGVLGETEERVIDSGVAIAKTTARLGPTEYEATDHAVQLRSIIVTEKS